ncbi:MAG: YifB family Mg chelatase-like AAA ATPase [Bacteroides sp.]|nr:YifB family Mg chelatase-like AAA ATPase [Prevotella sp.]MCM1408795.1 YifB family Mg chelatase-like AAA ATPase [Treponema brennaborense]MCM1470575.1 YifB family Mg chelatase-like AAA ATPase [Bacteroides sp.]
MTIISFSPFGYEGELVTVEVDLRRGIPAIDLVGLADNAVKESRERMRAAVRNSGFDFPQERVLISLSPADVKKEGAGFDLAIALAVLAAKYNIPNPDAAVSVLIMGELELSGKIRPVRGVHAAAATAVENNISVCIVPAENGGEAAGTGGDICVFPVNTLKEAFHVLSTLPETLSDAGQCSRAAVLSDMHKTFLLPENAELAEENIRTVFFPPVAPEEDFCYVKNQPELVRGLQIAAAGGHNLIAYGAPGTGKTLALQRFRSLLPYLTADEAQSVTRIHSLAGNMPHGKKLLFSPPFRIPHQSATLQGMTGGGNHCLPGEISLAHNGVLFLDEAAEFRTSVLQALRVPLENEKIALSRAGRHTIYPAHFQLLIAANPCPCGNFGSKNKVCVCSARSVEQYWKKFSAPLLDRIDIRVPVNFPDEKNNDSHDVKTSRQLRIDIARAVEIQRARQGKRNSCLLPEEISCFCEIDGESQKYLSLQIQKYNFSARAVHSCIKLARTIADMSGNRTIRKIDLEEAVFFRRNEGGVDICF